MLCHWSLSIPPENMRKPLSFFFQGVMKETSDMIWVSELMSFCKTSYVNVLMLRFLPS